MIQSSPRTQNSLTPRATFRDPRELSLSAGGVKALAGDTHSGARGDEVLRSDAHLRGAAFNPSTFNLQLATCNLTKGAAWRYLACGACYLM